MFEKRPTFRKRYVFIPKDLMELKLDFPIFIYDSFTKNNGLVYKVPFYSTREAFNLDNQRISATNKVGHMDAM
jgi:hypothetical protein